MTARSHQSTPAPARRGAAKLAGTKGSSILIALVFFLICAVVGSVVLTAASVSAKSAATYRETQQAEFAVTSAAEYLSNQFNGTSATWYYPEGSDVPEFEKSTYAPEGSGSDHETLWRSLGTEIWAARTTQQSYTAGAAESDRFKLTVTDGGTQALDPVYFSITFDRDLNITIDLSLDRAMGATSPYNERLTLQATPTFDGDGRMVSVSWGAPAITKTSASEGAAA